MSRETEELLLLAGELSTQNLTECNPHAALSWLRKAYDLGRADLGRELQSWMDKEMQIDPRARMYEVRDELNKLAERGA